MRAEITGINPATPGEPIYLDITGLSTPAQSISVTGHFGYGKTLHPGEESSR